MANQPALCQDSREGKPRPRVLLPPMAMETPQPATALADAALAQRAREGGAPGQAALGELLTRHARRLHRFFAMQFGEAELAADLTQEVFARVIGARERIPPDEGFRPWIWTIAINLAHSQRRRRTAAPPTFSMHDSEPEQPAIEESLPDLAPSPRDMSSADERARHLRAAIGRLDEPQREVILLKYFQNLPCRDVAQVLGVTEGTVWSRTHRALAQLRTMMAAEGGESA
jgi:RNA polymerase sigma-70 factor, ECF subfamily